MIKILDLFSGTQSVRKALDDCNVKYEYYGIDIYSPEKENVILDLSQDDIVNKVIAALPDNWKPDFIWASPVCNKFSIATAVKGGNLYFEKTRQGVKPRTNLQPLENTNFKKYTLETITKETTLHLKLVSNMQKILDYYNVNFVIENPRTSYMVYYLNPLYVPNKVDYCMYGFEYKKPTTIYSNYNLGLNTCNHKKSHDAKIGTIAAHKKTFQANVGKYSDRASVPPKLIQTIFKRFDIL
jgi:hypothetical protein